MAKSKYAKSGIKDPQVITVAASAEYYELDTKHFAQRWIANVLTTKKNSHNNDFKR